MTRRTLLKLLSLLPFAGPVISKALAQSNGILTPAYAPYLPKEFPKWDKAIDGLEDAGKWVLDIERAQLPQDIRFPRPGEVWEAVCDCEVWFRARFSKPWPGFSKVAAPMVVAPDQGLLLRALLGGKARLRRGEKVRILEADDPKPVRITFQPIRYEDLHPDIVPEDIRRILGYVGYELSLQTAKPLRDFAKGIGQTFFNEAFRLAADLT
jgi:hypothetical protein